MPVTKIPFDYTLTKIATAGSNDLVCPVVEAGWMYCVNHITVENLTTNYTSLRLIKVVAGQELVVAYYAPCLVGVPDWYDFPSYHFEGQYALVRMAGCAAADQLRVYVSGYKQTLPAYWEVV